MKITIHKLLKGSVVLPDVNEETHTGLGQIQKQPQANVNFSNSSTGTGIEKHKMITYHLTPESGLEKKTK